MSTEHDSVKKKTLELNSRSILFATGLPNQISLLSNLATVNRFNSGRVRKLQNVKNSHGYDYVIQSHRRGHHKAYQCMLHRKCKYCIRP